MNDWSSEKRARFVFFLGLGLMALMTIIPSRFWERMHYDVRWVYQDGCTA